MKDLLLLVILLFIGVINISLFLGFVGFFSGAMRGAPFIPSSEKTTEKMINFANIQKNEIVFDLGCGDGRLVFSAAKKTENAFGVEISRIVFLIAKLRKFFLKEKGTILLGSLWNVDLKNADIIFLYLLPPMMQKFEKEIYPLLKKGTRIISHGFKFPNLIPKEILEGDIIHGKILKYQKD
jgi:SAM-dependent methyltransferase